MNGLRPALPQLQGYRSCAVPGHRFDQFIRQTSHGPAFETGFKTGHQYSAVFSRRSEIEKARARQQVFTRAGLGEAAHQPLQDVLPHKRTVPQRGILEQGQHRIQPGVRFRLQRPPKQERHTIIRGILVVLKKVANNREALARRQPPRRAGQLIANFQVLFRLRQLTEFLRKDRGNSVLIAQQPDGPEPDKWISIRQCLQRDRFRESAIWFFIRGSGAFLRLASL